ncbi:MAG: flagellar protein [Pseudomonadota bacterium]
MIGQMKSYHRTLALALAAVFVANASLAASKSKPKPTKAAAVAPFSTKTTKAKSLAQRYCLSIRNAAEEARYAFQIGELKRLQAKIDKRLVELRERAAELKEWLAKRDAFSKRATENLVTIFATMRAEAASAQLAKLNLATSAAIITKLEPRAAAAILAEMPAEDAAKLAAVISGAADGPKREQRS